MRIPSGKTDQSINFVARDTSTRARKTGLTSFTVYRSRNGGTATVYTTPTVVELSAANMPGVYALLIDEDATIASGSDSEEYVLHISATNMVSLTRTIELYRRDTTSGNTALIDSSGRCDVSKIGGTTQTARDLGASVLLSSGTGTGQLDLTSGVVKSSLVQILGTAITETAGQIAAGFKKVFDVTTPVFTAASVNQTGDNFARIGAAGAGLTALGDTRIANLDAAVSTRLAASGYTAPTTSPTAAAIRAEMDSNSTKLASIDAKTTNLPSDPADESIILAAITAASAGSGVGAITWPYTITDSSSGLPIADVSVWVTSDSAGLNVLASGRTSQSGVVTFYLNAGAVYVFRQKSGYNFTNPDTEVVS